MFPKCWYRRYIRRYSKEGTRAAVDAGGKAAIGTYSQWRLQRS